MSFLGTLLKWLSAFWDGLKWLISESWRQIGKVFESVWGWGLIAVGWVYTAIKWVDDGVAELAQALDAMVMPTIAHGTPFMDGMNFINAVLPLDFILGMAIGHVGLKVSLIVYRFIKSWLPTLS